MTRGQMDKTGRLGQYINCTTGDESYKAFIPQKLPPIPSIVMDDLFSILDSANTALGRLDGMSMILPDPSLFLYMYVRKEAVLSSQIEGTQSSLSDLLMFETNMTAKASIDDVTEVSNYVSAMNHGLERLKDFPLSLRLIKEIHKKLMCKGRGSDKCPGEFRTSQNWIGGSRPGNALFVPTPPQYLMETLSAFELFLHDKSVQLPTLIKAALAHIQFESIHPFLDGNGRLGRLLITFILCNEGILKTPLLYLSLYFKENREAYYNHLQSVRTEGNWEEWIHFFLTGIVETANEATETAQAIIKLFSGDLLKIESSPKSTAAVLTIHNYFKKHPISNTTKIKAACNVSLPTVLRSLATLDSLGVIEEITGKERHKVFAYKAYLTILNTGTETFLR